MMTPREQLASIIKELDALSLDLMRMRLNNNEEIKTKWHDEVVNVLKSVVARSENMENVQKELF